MPYFPLSQIKTNLYSNGEFVQSNNQELYTGYYWKNSLGKYYTGKSPQDEPTIELLPIPDSFRQTDIIESTPSLDTIAYSDTTQTQPPSSNIPPYFATLPTEQDYQIGEFRRYFCKKSNEILYIEISKTSYDLLETKSDSLLWQLYIPFNLPWRLTGTKEEAFRINRNLTALTSQRLQLPKLGEYLKNDYLKYYK
jgi:hypothetical protein